MINLPVPKSQEAEATEDIMKKLEIIVDDGETLWFYPNSPTRIKMMRKGCDEVYESPGVHLDWVDIQKYSFGDHIRNSFRHPTKVAFPPKPVDDLNNTPCC